MRTKQKAALLVAQRLARDRTEAYHDARALALEFARGEPCTWFDQMAAGVVLHPGETVYRQLPIWVRVLQDGLGRSRLCKLSILDECLELDQLRGPGAGLGDVRERVSMIPASIHSSRRRRNVVAEQWRSP